VLTFPKSSASSTSTPSAPSRPLPCALAPRPSRPQPRMPHPRWSRRHSAHELPWRANRARPAVSGMLGAHTAAVKRQTTRPDQQERRLAAEARRRPPRPSRIRSGRDAARLGRGGTGLGPDRAIPRSARIFRMTAGSCSVAIRRSRPPQCGHARTSIANAQCIKAAQLSGSQRRYRP
jgi:hypothetical protein